MKERKARIWKVEDGQFIEISPSQLEAENISNYLTEEEIYHIFRHFYPPSLKEE